MGEPELGKFEYRNYIRNQSGFWANGVLKALLIQNPRVLKPV